MGSRIERRLAYVGSGALVVLAVMLLALSTSGRGTMSRTDGPRLPGTLPSAASRAIESTASLSGEFEPEPRAGALPYAAFGEDDSPPSARGRTASEGREDPGPDHASATRPGLAQGAAISLTASVDYDGDGIFHRSEVGTGTVATWRFVVRNTGDCDLTWVGVIDYYAAFDDGPETLAPGERSVFEYQGPVSGDLDNRARATARGPGGSYLDPVYATASVRSP